MGDIIKMSNGKILYGLPINTCTSLLSNGSFQKNKDLWIWENGKHIRDL